MNYDFTYNYNYAESDEPDNLNFDHQGEAMTKLRETIQQNLRDGLEELIRSADAGTIRRMAIGPEHSGIGVGVFDLDDDGALEVRLSAGAEDRPNLHDSFQGLARYICAPLLLRFQDRYEKVREEAIDDDGFEVEGVRDAFHAELDARADELREELIQMLDDRWYVENGLEIWADVLEDKLAEREQYQGE